MQCSTCGYMMSDFDAECIRCKNIGKPKPNAKIDIHEERITTTRQHKEEKRHATKPINVMPNPVLRDNTPSNNGCISKTAFIILAIVVFFIFQSIQYTNKVKEDTEITNAAMDGVCNQISHTGIVDCAKWHENLSIYPVSIFREGDNQARVEFGPGFAGAEVEKDEDGTWRPKDQ